MPSPIKAKCSGKKKHREEAWSQTRKERTDDGEPRALERISRGKEFRAMLQLMRIKPRRIYHAAGHSLLSLRLCASACQGRIWNIMITIVLSIAWSATNLTTELNRNDLENIS
ncbi:hypothetical protein ALC53_11967 [Atta colombica]|uniref:Uncharacterized protein n=1 Tax=Atta colombica TaxID=520822 RepID=A0A195AZJ5_9HYME|nr:hypothetical protein ALC53_11967 [Atta colombica]